MGLITLRSLLLGAATGTRTEVDDTVVAILRATLDCLARHGTDRMSVADVASGAGVGRATVFRRFATKQELVRAAYGWELTNILREFHRATRSMTDPSDRIQEWFVRAIRVVRTHPVARRIVADGNALEVMGDPQVVETLLNSVEAQLRHTLGDCRPDLDTGTVAELITRFFVSTWLTPDLGTATASDQGARRIASAMLALPRGRSPTSAGSGPVSPAPARAPRATPRRPPIPRPGAADPGPHAPFSLHRCARPGVVPPVIRLPGS